MKNWRQGIIYKYTYPSNKIYIGQTIEEKIRKRRHRTTTAKNGTKFGNAIKKYGIENFQYEVLFRSEWVEDIKTLQQTLNELEIKYIEEFDSFNSGYNLTKGGDGVKSFKHSEETKKLISEHSSNMSEETRLKISKANKWKTVSEEIRKKISEGNKGKIRSEKVRKEMSDRQKGKTYTEEQIQKYKDSAPSKKTVYQYTKTNMFIESFPSCKEAGRKLKLDYSAISKCCRGVLKSTGGYI